jgi:hypothetical protein
LLCLACDIMKTWGSGGTALHILNLDSMLIWQMPCSSAIFYLANEPMVDFGWDMWWTLLLLTILFKFCMLNIACCWENFILALIGPVWYIIWIKCYKICEVKSNLWLQCDELSKCDFLSRIKVCQCQLDKQDFTECLQKMQSAFWGEVFPSF